MYSCSSKLMAKLLLSSVRSPEGISFESCFTIVFKHKALWPDFKAQLAGNAFSSPEEHLKPSKIVLLHAEMD